MVFGSTPIGTGRRQGARSTEEAERRVDRGHGEFFLGLILYRRPGRGMARRLLWLDDRRNCQAKYRREMARLAPGAAVVVRSGRGTRQGAGGHDRPPSRRSGG